MKILFKAADADLKTVDTNCQYRTEGVQGVLGKGVRQQAVWLNADRTLAMICDEEGCFKNLDRNFFMDFANPFHPVQMIFGNVAFVRTKPADVWNEEIWDYEIEDIREDDIRAIKELLSPERQIELALSYFS